MCDIIFDMHPEADLLRAARERAGLSQRELARRANTSQPAIARAETGRGGITVTTLRRLLEAAGFDLGMTIEPQAVEDPVTAMYRREIDRTLLRQNLRRGVHERLRAGAEMVTDLRALENATRAVRRGRGEPG